jgi:D-glycero-D-manno-heptose 1,7-bisphosphate phosphatase
MSLLILDRDGVINQDSDDYIKTLEEWIPIPGSIEAIARLSGAGYQVCIATNQSGLGRGYFELDVLEEIHQHLADLVERAGGSLAGIFYCSHLPDEGCACRKPRTGLITAIEAELGLSAQGAWFVGDSLKDLQAAQRHGCKPLLVTTGKGQKTLAQLRSAEVDLVSPETVPVYGNLAEATDAILD